MPAFLISSCAGTASEKVKGLEGISDINHTLLIKKGASNDIIGAPIQVLIVNASQYPLYFPKNYGLQVFALLQNRWQRLPARVFPASPQRFVLPPFPKGGMEQIVIYPKIPSKVETVTLLIITRGQKKEAAGEPAGAYLEITLHREK